ncbi:hypothetical protein ML401_15090 [Bradyrhizobium sp. 62B]|jgi:hypothetical protein|uniref:hypothetical protein n=1 Tax=unclassified Bradyrhizobium TaxID=2631580 RepID=UPI001BA682BE|nr:MULTISPECIES: hypothetical protein [Bradyrhizobium]MBR0931346.1 hypothetical protein [Bradyrhizobium diazoefficiens]MDT4737683.1 hypothetical protein [Bradyrhizobium sp. WYCCWR 12699]WIW49355.1 hypothetical protein ML401_15090 [Bradyrhizobium sp. 62B]
MKLKTMLAASLCSIAAAANAAPPGTSIADAAQLHQEYTDVVIASEQCPGVILDIKKWDGEVRKLGGPGVLKAFDVSEQGGAWRDKRYDEFKANPAKQCAEALETYGPKGMGLLQRK